MVSDNGGQSPGRLVQDPNNTWWRLNIQKTALSSSPMQLVHTLRHWSFFLFTHKINIVISKTNFVSLNYHNNRLTGISITSFMY